MEETAAELYCLSCSLIADVNELLTYSYVFISSCFVSVSYEAVYMSSFMQFVQKSRICCLVGTSQVRDQLIDLVD